MNGVHLCRVSARLAILGTLGLPVLLAGCGQPSAKRQQQAAADDLGVPAQITNSIGMELILIPAGEFMMGSESGEYLYRQDDEYQHPVRITEPFYLGVYEVTQAEYEEVMGENPSYFKGATRPVENVSWHDATEFCKRLSAKEGKTYRLPTEAEWEYACRAGTRTRFSFGDDSGSFGEYAWYKSNSEEQTHPVGKKKANAWGLHDMHGNAWEWCQDWYDGDYYRASPVDDPGGPSSGTEGRVFRGSSWRNLAEGCSAARRNKDRPEGRDVSLGFRVALGPSGRQPSASD